GLLAKFPEFGAEKCGICAAVDTSSSYFSGLADWYLTTSDWGLLIWVC
ncbi:hypothetical protein Tco_1339111, partial [Tanacetum coccineum]